jgi:hypothetical protein
VVRVARRRRSSLDPPTCYDVLRNTHGTRLYHQPVVGDLTLDFEVVSPVGDEHQVVALHSAEPSSPSERGLHQLAHRVTENPPRSARILAQTTVDQSP